MSQMRKRRLSEITALPKVTELIVGRASNLHLSVSDSKMHALSVTAEYQRQKNKEDTEKRVPC